MVSTVVGIDVLIRSLPRPQEPTAVWSICVSYHVL
jgi:hypothetical protein